MGFLDNIKKMLSPSTDVPAEKSGGCGCGGHDIPQEKAPEPKPEDTGCCGGSDHDDEDKASGGCGCC